MSDGPSPAQKRFWGIFLLILGGFLFFSLLSRSGEVPEKDFSTFRGEAKEKKISQVTITGYRLSGQDSQGKPFRVTIPKDNTYELAKELEENGVKVKLQHLESSPWLDLLSWLPFILMALFFLLLMRGQNKMMGGGRGIFSFNSRTRLPQLKTVVTFNDVAGVEEAKEELAEMVKFLKDPKKFQKLGGKIPKGVLLTGSPGTGKTLLARAVAGEAKVPFFIISGSDFVEMFVGVGASRVRNLFEQGKKNAPCIIFIDEIDAVGRRRGTGLGGGHDEREQTLNQLLVEMDGFETDRGVIVIAASNRADVLDPALLRPGRFDRQVVVSLPDLRGREEILKVHTRKIPLDQSVDLSVIARGTPGFSGAALANLANEAALRAASYNRAAVTQDDLEASKDKVLMGKERRSLVMTEREKKITAYHEAGHTLVALHLKDSDPIHKVTILPRGPSLGSTWQLPKEDVHNYSKERLEAMLAINLGGRCAEKLMLKSITTGASNDLEQATNIATQMVTRFGFSDYVGLRTFADNPDQPFIGLAQIRSRHYSEDTAQKIDKEIHDLLETARKTAEEILENHKDQLTKLAHALLERETLNLADIQQLLAIQPAP